MGIIGRRLPNSMAVLAAAACTDPARKAPSASASAAGVHVEGHSRRWPWRGMGGGTRGTFAKSRPAPTTSPAAWSWPSPQKYRASKKSRETFFSLRLLLSTHYAASGAGCNSSLDGGPLLCHV